jgi:phosphoglycolate phosphatase-like HAD superfamily hydrolase
VILDVDGTLVDSNDAHAHAWVDAFSEAGITVPFDPVRRSIGMGGDKLMPIVAGIQEDSPIGTSISTRRRSIFKERYLPGVRGFPAVRELVAKFLDDGFRVAVASSAKKDELEPLLARASVADLIGPRTSSDDAEESKPDPDIVHAAMQRSGAEASRTIMLGDTPFDVQAARLAGIAIVALECGGWKRRFLDGAAAVYRDPADLLRNYDTSPFAQLRNGHHAKA